ncbi:MAG: GTP-binding protein [Candidatus Thorarchaeota archaeon]|nr:GTP-binding protein [Candidatus Thorarchaeota archaeon]
MGGPSGRYFKVCLIGDGYVGKTSIRRQYLGKTFKSNYIATLGVDFAQKTLMLDSGPVHLVIWDIAGQPLFQGLRRRYYDGCSGIILAYSVVDRESFTNASKWLVEAHDFMGILPPIIVAGNKIDLRPTHPKEDIVSYDEGLAFAKKTGEKLKTQTIFIETSALTGENIDEAFESLMEMIMPEIKARVTEQVAKTPHPETLPEVVSEPAKSHETVISSVKFQSPMEVEAGEGPIEASDLPSTSQDRIGREMAALVNLRAELRNVESELNDITTKLDTAMLNLTNVIQVKRIMYEHLKKQLQSTRQEWAEAYEEYVKTNQRKKKEVESGRKKIEEAKTRIEKAERDLREKVQPRE